MYATGVRCRPSLTTLNLADVIFEISCACDGKATEAADRAVWRSGGAAIRSYLDVRDKFL
jgi:hypothetical protein